METGALYRRGLWLRDRDCSAASPQRPSPETRRRGRFPNEPASPPAAESFPSSQMQASRLSAF